MISSLLAVGLIEAYLLSRRRLAGLPLRRVLNFPTKVCSVVCPVFPLDAAGAPLARDGLMTLYDAHALAYLLEACGKRGIRAETISMEKVTDVVHADFLSIGGPSGNKVCGLFLRTYCPGFEVHAGETELHSSTFYRCGGRDFADTDDEVHFFVIKLTPEVTNLAGTAIFVWGRHPIATAAGAYLLGRRPDLLGPDSSDSFFIAAKTSLRMGHRSVSAAVVDLTEDALKRP